jgi:hypothetical protein
MSMVNANNEFSHHNPQCYQIILTLSEMTGWKIEDAFLIYIPNP